MSTAYRNHEERTADDYRQQGLHRVRLADVRNATSDVKTIRLDLIDKEEGLQFQPGQWLDVFVPGVPKAGGFTITSSPLQSAPHALHDINGPCVELAVKHSPGNPPAVWLWQPLSQILNATLLIRVGGSFTYPPRRLMEEQRRRVVFIAGGVGINPFKSMISHFELSQKWPDQVTLLYGARRNKTSTQASEPVLFDPLFSALATSQKRFKYTLHLTGNDVHDAFASTHRFCKHKRITLDDVEHSLGSEANRAITTVYVCGPQAMTDDFVDRVSRVNGLSPERVLCEKWW